MYGIHCKFSMPKTGISKFRKLFNTGFTWIIPYILFFTKNVKKLIKYTVIYDKIGQEVLFFNKQILVFKCDIKKSYKL